MVLYLIGIIFYNFMFFRWFKYYMLNFMFENVLIDNVFIFCILFIFLCFNTYVLL